MLAGVLLVMTTLVALPDAPFENGSATPIAIVAADRHLVQEQAPPVDPPPQPTINEFIPEDRSIGECISALPKPGCGSEARGGWRQSLILVAILGGLGFIVWRVVRSARRAKAEATTATAAEPS